MSEVENVPLSHTLQIRRSFYERFIFAERLAASSFFGFHGASPRNLCLPPFSAVAWLSSAPESIPYTPSAPRRQYCSSGTVPVPRATVLACISLRCPRPCVPVFPLSSRNDTAGAPYPCNCTVLHSRFYDCIF